MKKIVLFAIAALMISEITIKESVAETIEMPLSAVLSDSNTHFLPQSARAATVTSRIKTRKLRISSHKKSKKNASQKIFAGIWRTTLNQNANTCSGNLPASINIGININSKLVATDVFDSSPFFKGTVLAANKIGFARSRIANGCKQTQTLILGNVKGNKGFTALRSDTSCGANSCYTLYSGNSSRQ